jgi:hypothetical protein
MGGNCSAINRCQVYSGGYKATHSLLDARVLALHCYDMIVGEDWLEAISPVWVDYKTKEMHLTHQGRRITLQVIRDQLQECPEIPRKKVQGLVRSGAVAYCIQLDSDMPIESMSDELQCLCAI